MEVNLILKKIKKPKIDQDLHHLRQRFQKKTGDHLKVNLKRIQKENQTLKRVRKGKKVSIYFLDNVPWLTNNVSVCFENSSIGCTQRDKSSFLDLSLFLFFRFTLLKWAILCKMGLISSIRTFLF